MALVYKYTDLSDNIVKYIGIVHGENRTLKQRVYEHSVKDMWCIGKTWDIEYFEVASRTDAELLESHFISLYKTYIYFNQSKSDWGESNLLNNIQIHWQKYHHNINEESNNIIYDIALTYDFNFTIKTVRAIKSNSFKIMSDMDYLYCKNCGSGNLYKKNNGTKHGAIHCAECDSWVTHGNKIYSNKFTPFYNGEYKKDANGDEVLRTNYIICFGQKSSWKCWEEKYLTECHRFGLGSPSRNFQIINNKIFSYTYALSESDIEKQKEKLVKFTKLELIKNIQEQKNELKKIKETTILNIQNQIKETTQLYNNFNIIFQKNT